jgi:hypothetical protein
VGFRPPFSNRRCSQVDSREVFSGLTLNRVG